MNCRSLRLVVAALVVTTACGNSDEPRPEAAPCRIPAATDRAGLVPEDLGLAEHGTITAADRHGRRLTATLVTDTAIVELYPPLARRLLDSRYTIVSGENEGTDAEIFFARGPVSGVYLMRQGPCGDLVTLTLDYVRERKSN